MVIDKTFVIDARDVHEKLGIKTKFSAWIYKALPKADVRNNEYVLFKFKTISKERGVGKLRCLLTKDGYKKLTSYIEHKELQCS